MAINIEYKDWDWNPAGKVSLDSNVFDGPLRKDIIARVIRWQQAKSRSGNHSTKTLSMVSGTTRKPWAQKETGRARQGSLRAPHFRGGGVVFGPHPRDYEHKLNKKVRSLAFISSLSFKLQEGLFDVIASIEFPFSKTSAFSGWLKDRKMKSVLFVVSNDTSLESFFGLRNVPYCDVLKVSGLNVLDIVKHKNIICDLTALKEIEARFCNRISKSGVVKSDMQSGDEIEKSSKKASSEPENAQLTKISQEVVVDENSKSKSAPKNVSSKNAVSKASSSKVAKKTDEKVVKAKTTKSSKTPKIGEES